MTLMQLKEFIINKTIPSDFMIFSCKDNHFLAQQYLNEISNQKVGNINKIQSIFEPQQNSLFLLTDQEEALNVLITEVFEERAEDYSQFTDTIVICDKVEKTIEPLVKDYIIEMPKFQAWQIEDYAKTLCPEVEEADLKWLVEASNEDIYRVLNELDKVQIFNKEDRRRVFSEIRYDPQSDLYNLDLFKVTNAFVDGDMQVLFDFLRHKDFMTLEPIMLSNRILTSLKNILLVTQNLNATATELGVSDKQLWKLRSKYKTVNIDAIKYKIKFLTNIDLALKSSELEMSKQNLMNYLVANLAFKIT